MFSLTALRRISDRWAWCAWSARSNRSRSCVSTAAILLAFRSDTTRNLSAASLQSERSRSTVRRQCVVARAAWNKQLKARAGAGAGAGAGTYFCLDRRMDSMRSRFTSADLCFSSVFRRSSAGDFFIRSGEDNFWGRNTIALQGNQAQRSASVQTTRAHSQTRPRG